MKRGDFSPRSQSGNSGSGFNYFARLDACRADLHLLDFTVQDNPCILEVGLPGMLGMLVGVADPVSHRGFPAAYITLPGHYFLLGLWVLKRLQYIVTQVIPDKPR
jgi:hypothetical protein